MMLSKRNSDYIGDDISVLDGLPPLKNPAPRRPYIDLRPEKLHGIALEESDRRYKSIRCALTMTEAAGLPVSEDMLLQSRRYISGELSLENPLSD